jgi:hypothetical protein
MVSFVCKRHTIIKAGGLELMQLYNLFGKGPINNKRNASWKIISQACDKIYKTPTLPSTWTWN